MSETGGPVADEAGFLLHPGEPVPVQFMNTIWAERGVVHDELADVDGLMRWLTAAAEQVPVLTEPPIQGTPDDLRRYRQLRDALRRMAAAVTADERSAAASPAVEVDAAVDEVNRTAALASIWPELDWSGESPARVASTDAPAMTAGLSWLARAGIDLFAGEAMPRIRACYAPGCVLYFVKDHPRREWCSASCGNRARAARHYQRHRQS